MSAPAPAAEVKKDRAATDSSDSKRTAERGVTQNGLSQVSSRGSRDSRGSAGESLEGDYRRGPPSSRGSRTLTLTLTLRCPP